jgi:uncharacterized protein (DUF2235 family)
MPETKRCIALFLDGTWNTVTSNTNVWRLRSLCEDNYSQLVYYNAGVGTQYGEKLRGGMFGFGLDQEVIDAYEWLIQHYSTGDELFIFGFSRGAYTARSLSGLISKCGLLQAGAPLGVGQLYDRYRRGIGIRTIRELVSAKNKANASFSVEESWMLEYSAPIAIKFIGVWDTVGALGVPFGNIPIISRSNYKFLETDLRINNDNAYHALAIDEHRKDFAPTLWTKTVKTNSGSYPPRSIESVEQRWFVGAHANVGGGYPSDFLAQIPLKWLMSKAIIHGLSFQRDVVIGGNENSAPIADSYRDSFCGLYRFLRRPYYRPIGCGPLVDAHSGDVTTTINETIDVSVFDRWRKDSAYRPQNLMAWARGNEVNVESLQQSIRADQPATAVPDAATMPAAPPTPGSILEKG